MTQSVELVLDPVADATVQRQWAALATAGLPSEERPGGDEHHRPHITLYAGAGLSAEADAALPQIVGQLDLSLLLGSIQLFGPGRGRGGNGSSYVLVRPVTMTGSLLDLQREVAERCQADPAGQFGPGRWSPHVTLAKRINADQVGTALEVLERLGAAETVVRVSECRRWDGDLRAEWRISL